MPDQTDLRILGDKSYIEVGSQRIEITRVAITPRARRAEVTDSSNQGWASFLLGIKEWTADVTGFWYKSKNIHENPPDLKVGQEITLKVYFKDGSTFYSGTALVEEQPITMSRGDPIEYRMTLLGNGPLTYPISTFT